MSNRTIEVDIEADGSVTIDAKGFTGNACSTATRSLELALAGAAANVDDKKKPDFYATNPGTISKTN